MDLSCRRKETNQYEQNYQRLNVARNQQDRGAELSTFERGEKSTR
jgi:hypothetical protein